MNNGWPTTDPADSFVWSTLKTFSLPHPCPLFFCQLWTLLFILFIVESDGTGWNVSWEQRHVAPADHENVGPRAWIIGGGGRAGLACSSSRPPNELVECQLVGSRETKDPGLGPFVKVFPRGLVCSSSCRGWKIAGRGRERSDTLSKRSVYLPASKSRHGRWDSLINIHSLYQPRVSVLERAEVRG